jgi:uncharacterized integral membrane protein (TIGR00697 family)
MSDARAGAGWSGTGTVRISLIALFVTSLVTGQILAAKVLGFALSGSLPLVGAAIIVPAGVLAYALTFFSTDCLSELYGKRTAQVVVNVGFAMNFVVLALVYLALSAPSARALGVPAGVDPAAFSTVLGFTPGIVLGSLVAYVVSQNWDVLAFHAIRERTGVDHLWLRNVGSTATSQLIDTVLFILIGFWLAPVLLGVGQPAPAPVLVALIAGQYVVKLLIAVVDTPFVYLVVGYARSRGLADLRAAPE